MAVAGGAPRTGVGQQGEPTEQGRRKTAVAAGGVGIGQERLDIAEVTEAEHEGFERRGVTALAVAARLEVESVEADFSVTGHGQL